MSDETAMLIDCLRYRPIATTAAQMRDAADEIERQSREILALREQVAALESREVCTVAHDNVETCGYCQRDALRDALSRIEDATTGYGDIAGIVCRAAAAALRTEFNQEPDHGP